ncbi:MAG TPA: hypothetical protein VLN59_04625 [Burkholderiales bacterium]|nr:hypothetical protein [Burkholderiales bacterium]
MTLETDPDVSKTRIGTTVYTIGLAIIAAVIWNIVPYWFTKDSLSEPIRALWIWGVFPLSIPVFYAFIDRFLKRR